MKDNEQPEAVESLTATERVSIYCDASDKEQWTNEAEEVEYSSRSEYLFELIQESRRYRAKGFLSREQKQEKISQLQSEIKQLEVQLENKSNQDQMLTQTLANPELAKRILSNRYQPLQEVVRLVLAMDSVEVTARDPVERALFQLAQTDDAEYRRGHGWRLVEDR